MIHSLDGYDEISLTGKIKVFSPKGESLIEPADFGLATHNPEDITGGESIEDSARIFMKVLKNEGTPQQINTVAANAAVALQCYHKDMDLIQALALANETIVSGRALERFNRLIQLQR